MSWSITERNVMFSTQINSVLDAMSEIIGSLLPGKDLGSLVSSDLMLDGKWAAKHGRDPFYWVITSTATGIGQDPSLTVDYYREQTPESVIACYRWNGASMVKLPNDVIGPCPGDTREDLGTWEYGDLERVQM